ncbi:sigma-70 family RNA polymerase sigma factor [Candidatus Peregrinibacteria bacterium]|nr:MAG: sigma-70 family RNA polymerase sigma factor [Candidatus Peregrinibacteria bacterium]
MNSALIEKAKVNPDAFGNLYEAFYDPLYRFVYIRVKNQDLCEDLLSQVWEKVLTHLKTLKSNAPEVFRAWIFRITLNTIHEHFRQHGKTLLPFPEDWDPPGNEDPIEELHGKTLEESITLVLHSLPPIEREICSLKIFGELKNNEIAKCVNRSENLVAAYLSRSLKQVRTRLSSHLY